MKIKIIILGGGYGGIKALESFANHKNIEVTLIDQHTYHYLQTQSYDLVASKISLEKTFIYLPTLVKGIDKNFNFIQDEAIDIDKKQKKLICKNGIYKFDFLIIAIGSVTKFLKGFEEKGKYSLGVKSLRGALNIKHFFEKELFDRLEPSIAKKCFNIVVIGGGLSGVEIASEMKYYFNQYSKNNALSCGNINITLISKHILKNLDKKAQNIAKKRLEKLGVKIIYHHVKEINEKKLFLDNNEEIEFDFSIFTGGIEPPPLIKNLNFKKNKKGFLIVNEYLKVYDNIYAIGDCAFLTDRYGKPVPPTAQSAEQSGVIAAKNILAEIKNENLIKANIKMRGLAIALGGKFALIITPFNLYITSFIGYLIKKAIEEYYKIPLKLKAFQGFKTLKFCKKDNK